jgi:hypothetical protein
MSQFDELEIAGNIVNEVPEIVDTRSLLSVLSPREEEVLLLRLEALKVPGDCRAIGHQSELR